MPGKLLITGATGFLGKNILKQLDKDHIPYLGTSKNGSGKIIPINLTNLKQIKNIFCKHDISTVVHAGAFVNLSRDYETAADCIENNLIATINLLEACKGQKNIKFILISSEEVYGANDLPYCESQTPLPPSPYAVSKVATENYLRYFAFQNSMNAIVLRMSTMYGPHMPENKFFSKVIDLALTNKPIPLNSGINKRDYLFVEDAVEAILKAVRKNTKELFSIINIGKQTSDSLSKFVKTVVKISKSNSVIQYGTIPDRITESKDWFVDISKAQTELEWEPKTTLEDGIIQTIKFYRKKNEEDYK